MEKSKISEAELEIMKIVWEEKQMVSAYEIRKKLEDKVGWERTTILTLIRRLVKKGLLYQEKREVYYYSANFKEKDYRNEETSHFLEKVYNGNAKNLVAALCQNNNLKSEDIEELRKYLNEQRGKHI